jgi:hypothetical protein
VLGVRRLWLRGRQPAGPALAPRRRSRARASTPGASSSASSAARLQDNLRRHVEAAGLASRRRRVWNALRKPQKDLFWYERNWEEFERVFERYRRADLSKADPKAVAGIVAIDKWMARNQQAIELVLTSPHWPHDLTPLGEHLHTVQSRLGDRRRSPSAQRLASATTEPRSAADVASHRVGYVTVAVSQPRLAQTSNVAAARFIV